MDIKDLVSVEEAAKIGTAQLLYYAVKGNLKEHSG